MTHRIPDAIPAGEDDFAFVVLVAKLGAAAAADLEPEPVCRPWRPEA
jgi:hypothetical protein